jgi:hypothetical protein
MKRAVMMFGQDKASLFHLGGPHSRAMTHLFYEFQPITKSRRKLDRSS